MIPVNELARGYRLYQEGIKKRMVCIREGGRTV